MASIHPAYPYSASSNPESQPPPSPSGSALSGADSSSLVYDPLPIYNSVQPPPYSITDQSSAQPRKSRVPASVAVAHPYARLFAKKEEVKRRKIWNHALEKSLFSPYEMCVPNPAHVLSHLTLRQFHDRCAAAENDLHSQSRSTYRQAPRTITRYRVLARRVRRTSALSRLEFKNSKAGASSTSLNMSAQWCLTPAPIEPGTQGLRAAGPAPIMRRLGPTSHTL
ncbi:hypothetical protein DXG03_007081 [Asterophora parasitica]|uniref:Uncharacterized protein n=1 Tax=Asterophora parasitica TaxID=117018 RepID=A0A9P7KHS6_9AGAR|nr:hypothetical protein DXG03_007081 [Asterophora parasitica]